MQVASSRKAFGEALCEVGRKNPNVVCIVADVSSSVMTDFLQRNFPRGFSMLEYRRRGWWILLLVLRLVG